MGRLYPTSGGHLRLDDGGRRVWSTDGAPATLLPQSSWLSLSVTISFPDFIKRNAYLFDIFHNTTTDVTFTSCASFSTIIPGEWGYNRASPRTLADAVLGTVPSGVNHLEVQAQLTRTKSPTNYMAFAVPNLLTGQTHGGPGNSFTVEKVPGLFSRGFDVRLDGSTIILRRYQTVYGGPSTIPWNPGNAVFYGGGGKREGWTYGGGSNAENGHLMSVIQTKGPGGNVNKERGGSNQCSLTDTSDYSSTFTGTLTIKPGFIRS